MVRVLVLISMLGLPTSFAFAQDYSSEPTAVGSFDTQELPRVKGVVRRIDIPNAKITLKHEEIPNLGMPGMTMPFSVPDVQMLQGLRNGDRVLFTADMVNNELTATWIEKRP